MALGEMIYMASLCYDPKDYKNKEHYRIKMQCLWFDISLGGLGLILVVATTLQRRFKVASALVVEAAMMLFSMVIIIVGIFTDPFYIARLQGIENPGAFMQIATADTWILLLIELVITATHVTLPIRWCVLWPLEVFGLMVYPMVVVIIGTPAQETWLSSWLCLVCLGVFSMVGRRTVERLERQSFTNVVKERTLRVETEFKLSLMGEGGLQQVPTPRKNTSHASRSTHSLATDVTGDLFDNIHQGTAEARLLRFIEVGQSEHWLVLPADLQLAPHCLLGRGGFGLVVTGAFHGSPVAVKIPLQSSDVLDDVKRLQDIANELRVLRYVRHPNIAMFHGAAIDTNSLEVALVLELVEGPDLQAFVSANFRAKYSQLPAWDVDRFTLLLGICAALQYLHGQRPVIIHGDLKPGNVLVDQRGTAVRAKLLDFGLSRVLSKRVKPLGGTLAWVAPEVYRAGRENSRLRPSTSADVFSLGRVLYFVATGDLPMQGMSRRTLHTKFRKEDPRLFSAPWPKSCTPFERASQELSERCTAAESGDRPKVPELRQTLLGWCEIRKLSILRTATGMPGQGMAPGGGRDGGADAAVDGACAPGLLPWDLGLTKTREEFLKRSKKRDNRAAPTTTAPTTVAPPTAAPRAVARALASAKVIGKVVSSSATPSSGATTCSAHKERFQPVRGTPRPESLEQAENEQLGKPATKPEDTDKADEGAVRQLAEGASTAPLDGVFVATGIETRTAMLLSVLERWAIGPPTKERFCCPFHETLSVMKETARTMAGRKCDKVDFHRCCKMQCPECLAMLDFEGADEDMVEECDVCGYELEDKGAASKISWSSHPRPDVVVAASDLHVAL